jgi:uncharacterized RDD family membrane protein YckC
MVDLMNAIAQAPPVPASGSKLDNRRVLAAIVDLIIVTAGALLILFAGDSLSGDRQSALAAVILGWALYYFFALESGEGQTVGKKLMKIRVVRSDGRPAGMGEIAVRTILRVVDNYLVGLIVMLATGERRQRIGDLAAGTIVVDASAAAFAPAAPAASEQPVEEAATADEPEDQPAEVKQVATQTITLPSRPAPPSTLADLTAPEAEAPAVPELRPFPPVEAQEPASEDEPEDEPVAEEPEAADPVAEDEPGDILPELTTPALEELADDVAAAHVEVEPAGEDANKDDSADAAVEPVEDEPLAEDEPVEDEPVADVLEDDEPVNVKSVETVSAIDLVMGGVSEEDSSEDSAESAPDAEGPASA